MDEQERPTRCRVAAARAETKGPMVWVGQAVKQVVTDAEGRAFVGQEGETEADVSPLSRA
jgi:hypothetical protein